MKWPRAHCQIAFDSRLHVSPAVCGGGHFVVYASDFDGTNYIWKLDLQSGASTKLTNGPGEEGPRCAGAGDWVYYRGQVSGGSAHIFRVPVAGGEPVRVSDRTAISPPYLSPDGTRIGFAALRPNGRVGGLNFSTNSAAPVVSESDIRPTIDADSYAGCVMPDNRSMAIADVRSGVSNLWAIPQIGTGLDKQLTHFSSGSIWDCTYSPDRKLLLVAHGSNQSDVVLFTNAKHETF
jgi:hypothetical protein